MFLIYITRAETCRCTYIIKTWPSCGTAHIWRISQEEAGTAHIWRTSPEEAGARRPLWKLTESGYILSKQSSDLSKPGKVVDVRKPQRSLLDTLDFIIIPNFLFFNLFLIPLLLNIDSFLMQYNYSPSAPLTSSSPIHNRSVSVSHWKRAGL